jgi:hypothetical protein
MTKVWEFLGSVFFSYGVAYMLIQVIYAFATGRL